MNWKGQGRKRLSPNLMYLVIFLEGLRDYETSVRMVGLRADI
jgi:hypothetical protein